MICSKQTYITNLSFRENSLDIRSFYYFCYVMKMFSFQTLINDRENADILML